MTADRLSRAGARRLAARAQLLDVPRPTDLLTVVEQLVLVQVDPTPAVAPSADLVLWSRLGAGHRPGHLRQALWRSREQRRRRVPAPGASTRLSSAGPSAGGVDATTDRQRGVLRVDAVHRTSRAPPRWRADRDDLAAYG